MQTETRIAAVMAQHPDPDTISPNVVQKMVRKTLEIAAPKPATIKMKALRILGDSADTNSKFSEEIAAQLR
jgi:hypothetical protein